MIFKKLAIASDHAGFALKQELLAYAETLNLDVTDLGAHSEDSVDYPDFAFEMMKAIKSGGHDGGILVCGSGIGMSIAANRFSFIRAALCHDTTTASLSRSHNDANVLVLGSRLIGVETARDCFKMFIETAFDGGRHAARVDKLSRL